MADLKSQWERAHRSLDGLSVSQKLTAGLLIAVMIAAGVWLTRESERGRMEPVLDQAFADADLVQIAEHLTAKAVPHEVRDGRVYVPADRKLEVLSDLIYTDTLIGNTESGFDALIKQTSVFDTPSKTDKMFNHAREVVLQHVIGRFRGVRKSTVIIDPTNERHINGGSITPSALVDIQTRGGEGNPRQLASAAINAVTGAVSTMARERVKVTIDGASYNLGADEFGGDLLERRQQCEQAYVTKVRGLLSYIPDVLVSVSVDLNVQSLEEETHAESHTQQADPAGEEGNAVLANAVPSLADKPADSTPTTIGSRTQEGGPDYSIVSSETVQKKSHTPAGKETVLSASVVVPRSYFVQIYRRGAAKAAEPTEALLQPVVDAQLSKIRHLVRTSLGLKNDTDVTVEMYEDAGSSAPPPLAALPPRQEAVVVPPLGNLWNHRTQWGIGVIAGATLLIASMIFRRGSGAMAAPQVVHQRSSARAPARVRVTPAAVADGELEDEVDEEDDAVLLRQVRDLTAAHPDDAARVLRDWIHQG